MALWIFTRKILANEPIQLFNDGRMRRDFTYIDDIVSGVIACHDTPPVDNGQPKAGGSHGPHSIYNIGNDRAEELTRLVALIEAACQRKAQLELLPMQPGDVPETLADISAIRRDMGFAPTTSIDTGVPRFVQWYLDYRELHAP
jgi:UDP-glucuronate 4-epimerase